jgi:hypothetical protein
MVERIMSRNIEEVESKRLKSKMEDLITRLYLGVCCVCRMENVST